MVVDSATTIEGGTRRLELFVGGPYRRRDTDAPRAQRAKNRIQVWYAPLDASAATTDLPPVFIPLAELAFRP